MSAEHIPVLLHEAIEQLALQPEGFYIDCTFGRGGHSRAILENLSAVGRLIAFDQDPAAAKEARALFDPRFSFVGSSFTELAHQAEAFGQIGKVNGVLIDLGVSSPQLDNPERGFSFLQAGPLDMRMNPQQCLSLADWLKQVDEAELTRVLREYGEERFANRIARAILQAERAGQLSDTLALAQVISQANPRWEKQKHPATRSFQALRLAVNNELTALEEVLPQAWQVLAPGGRLVVISFHSLEDRLVKQFMKALAKPVLPARGLAIPDIDLPKPSARLVVGAIRAGKTEVNVNPRSRSAVLRVLEKL